MMRYAVKYANPEIMTPERLFSVNDIASWNICSVTELHAS